MDPTSLFTKFMNFKLVLLALTFGHAHPFVVGMAIVSLFGTLHDKLAAYPRVQALAHVARSFGINWSGVVDGAVRFVTGLPGAAAVKISMAFALVGVIFSASACHSAAPAKTADQARQEARAAAVTVEQAWMGLAHACVDAAAVTNDQQLLGECAAVLDPISVTLEAADDTINAWTTATSNQALACSLSRAAGNLSEAAMALGAPPTVKVAITDAIAVADALGGCNADGGK